MHLRLQRLLRTQSLANAPWIGRYPGSPAYAFHCNELVGGWQLDHIKIFCSVPPSHWGQYTLLLLGLCGGLYVAAGVVLGSQQGKGYAVRAHPHFQGWMQVKGLVHDGVAFSKARLQGKDLVPRGISAGTASRTPLLAEGAGGVAQTSGKSSRSGKASRRKDGGEASPGQQPARIGGSSHERVGKHQKSGSRKEGKERREGREGGDNRQTTGGGGGAQGESGVEVGGAKGPGWSGSAAQLAERKDETVHFLTPHTTPTFTSERGAVSICMAICLQYNCY